MGGPDSHSSPLLLSPGHFHRALSLGRASWPMDHFQHLPDAKPGVWSHDPRLGHVKTNKHRSKGWAHNRHAIGLSKASQHPGLLKDLHHMIGPAHLSGVCVELKAGRGGWASRIWSIWKRERHSEENADTHREGESTAGSRAVRSGTV